MKPAATTTRKSLWIPGLLAGFFLVLMMIEGNFIALAVKNRSSLVSDDAYDEGIRFNDKLKEEAHEKALGWQVAIHFTPSGSMAGTVEVSLADRNGQPLDASYEAVAERVTDYYQSVPLAFTNGRAPLAVHLPGRWFVRVRAHHDGDYVQKIQEIFVQP
jgi:nitrogen fixation protein FixH